jgi:hypothetical protein
MHNRQADRITPIAIKAKREPDGLILSVIGLGPGLPPGEETRGACFMIRFTNAVLQARDGGMSRLARPGPERRNGPKR